METTNVSSQGPVRWTGWRWWGAVGLVFGAQVVLVLRFSAPATHVPRQPPAGPVYKLLADATERQLDGFLAVSDPTVFALPNRHGFSGSAWLNPAPLERRASEETNQPYWLKPSVAPLGKDFDDFVKTNPPLPLTVAARVAPRVASFSLPNDLLATQSVLRIEGELAQRPLLARFDLPAIPHAEVLSNTIVRLRVNRAGYALWATLLARSGSPKADQLAYDLAKTARFQARPPGEGSAAIDPHALTSGDLIFQWRTIAETNSAANVRPP